MHIQHHSLNTRGRDFLVGNINGNSDLLLQRMYGVSFLPGTDRIFSVGDLLAHRRPGNLMAAILSMPGFHAVLGNHEATLLSHIRAHGIDDSVAPIHPALAWWHSTPLGERGNIAIALARLPLAIELESAEGRLGLVHADIPKGMSWMDFSAAARRDDPEVISHALTSTIRAHARDATGVHGIDQVFVGHGAPGNGQKRLGNVTYLSATYADVGAHASPGAASISLHPVRMQSPKMTFTVEDEAGTSSFSKVEARVA